MKRGASAARPYAGNALHDATGAGVAPAPAALASRFAVEEARDAVGEVHEVRRHQHDRGRVLLRPDLGDHLHAPELERQRLLAHLAGAVGQLLRRLLLALGLDDARALLAHRLGLSRHRPLHGLWDLDVLHLDHLDLDAPGFGRLVDDLAQDAVDAVALLQHLVQHMLADDVAQRGERHLVDRGAVVLHGDHGLRRVDDAEPQDGVDLDGDTVAGDRLLLLDRDRLRAQVQLLLPLDERNDPVETRPAHGLVAAEAEDDAALIFLGDPEAGKPEDDEGSNQTDDPHLMHSSLLAPAPVRADERHRAAMRKHRRFDSRWFGGLWLVLGARTGRA